MQNERLERRKEFIINTLYIALVAVLVFLCFKYVAKWLIPFIVGFVIAVSVNAPVKAICKKIKINQKFCAVVFLLIEYAIIVLIVWSVGAKIFSSIRDLVANLPAYYDESISPLLANLNETVNWFTSKVSPEVLNQIYTMLESVTDNLRDLIINISASMGKGLASPFLFMMLTLLTLTETALVSAKTVKS